MMRDLQCKARLADAAGTGEGQQAAGGILELLEDGVEFVFAPDEGGEGKRQGGWSRFGNGISLRFRERREGFQRINRFFLSRHFEKPITLIGWNLQVSSEQFRDLARGTAFFGLDLEDERGGTAHAQGEFLLRQIERFASAFDPGSERIIHGEFGVLYYFLSS